MRDTRAWASGGSVIPADRVEPSHGAGVSEAAPDGTGTVHEAATEQVRTEACGDPARGTWVLQADAAARTGFSVSAIRKWRRMGLVADRTITSSSGAERIEVKLEDVLARAALQPDRRHTEPPVGPPQTEARTVAIRIEDLEVLFERMLGAEQRAANAQAEAESLRAERRFILGQMAELRRQLHAQSSQQPYPKPAPATEREPESPKVREDRVAPLPPDHVVVEADAGMPPPAAPPVERSPADERRAEVRALARRLRQIYARLDEYRREAMITPATELQRQRELAEYDRVLVALCDALAIPTELPAGQPVSVEARASLTRALARAGLDVRSGARASDGARPRGAPAKHLS